MISDDLYTSTNMNVMYVRWPFDMSVSYLNKRLSHFYVKNHNGNVTRSDLLTFL